MIRKNDPQTPLTLRSTSKGMGVFATEDINKGTFLLQFQGPIISRSQYTALANYHNNHFLQVDSDLFMGPSGTIDDFINHSCDPNSGVVYSGSKIRLYSIQYISAGEEICFDYSTTMNEDFWEMSCLCGSPFCREHIKDFKHLPQEIQTRYITLGIVPEFVRNMTPGGLSISQTGTE